MPALFPAEIILKTVAGNDDKVMILVPRTIMILPFQAPNWTDLRVGFFLSLCSEDVDDPVSPITGLAETITNPTAGLGPEDRYWIGVKDRGQTLPKSPGAVFAGYSNASGEDATIEHTGNSRLTSSDINIGTSNAYFWRPNLNTPPGNGGFQRSGGIWQGPHPRFLSTDGVQQHFPQNTATPGAGGYATLLMLRITRPNKDSKALTVRVPHMGLRSADVMFTNTPTLDILRTNLTTFPTTVQQWFGNVATVPDALFLYWPFVQSRLRCHALGILSHN